MIDQGKPKRILIVDDELAVVDVLRVYLEAEGFEVEHVADGHAGLQRAIDESIALVLLDLNLPKLSGIEVFRQLRAQSNVPVIMVTSRGEEIDRVVGLELGADDYVAKPFSPREVVARVKNVLRRSLLAVVSAESAEANILRIRDLEIDRTGHVVRLSGTKVPLTPMEFRILDLLVRHPGRVFTRAQLLDALAGDHDDVFDRTLDRHIANVRRKLQDAPARPTYIETVLGIGYKFIA